MLRIRHFLNNQEFFAMFNTLFDVRDTTHTESLTHLSCGTPSANRLLRANLVGIDVSTVDAERRHVP